MNQQQRPALWHNRHSARTYLCGVGARCVSTVPHRILTQTLLLLLLPQEVDGLHRLELLHLQAYLDIAQALVSPYTPLRDTNLKRKSELLGLQV
jgi:hypothetical protein